MNFYEHYDLITYSNYHDTIGIFSKKMNPILKKFNLKQFYWKDFDNFRDKYIYNLQLNDNLIF